MIKAIATKEEAKEIKKILLQATVLTRQKATENALKQVKRPDILHIATHGFFLENSTTNNQSISNLENPLLRSGLILAGVKARQSGGNDDGVLTALEVTSLNLVGTQLVVLSAYETGNGDISLGEGVFGLRRGFVMAGSESQLFSLWKVDDQQTKNLMISYYQSLKQGKGRAEALRDIQLKMIKDNREYSHPYYWASFIFSGDWNPIIFN